MSVEHRHCDVSAESAARKYTNAGVFRTAEIDRSKFCINKYEQEKQIENRISHLVGCLKVTENLRDDTVFCKNQIRAKLNRTFENVYLNLNKTIDKLYEKIERQLISQQMDVSLRNIEYDIHQLIGKLSSLSMLNDAEKLLLLKNIDQSIKQIEKNIEFVTNHKVNEIDKNLLKDQQVISGVVKEQADKLNQFIQDEFLTVNNLDLFQTKDKSPFSKNDDNSSWLLTKSTKTTENKQPAEIAPKTTEPKKRTNSFDFIDLKEELDSIQIVTDFDFEMVEKQPAEQEKSRQIKYTDERSKFEIDPSDGVSLKFQSIYSKPNDYWLLKQTN